MILDPVLILGIGTVSETGRDRGCNCHGDGAGDRHEYHDSWDHRAEKPGKCAEGYSRLFGKDPEGISEWGSAGSEFRQRSREWHIVRFPWC